MYTTTLNILEKVLCMYYKRGKMASDIGRVQIKIVGFGYLEKNNVSIYCRIVCFITYYFCVFIMVKN